MKLFSRADEIRGWIDELADSEEQVFEARQEAQILLSERDDLHPRALANIAVLRGKGKL